MVSPRPSYPAVLSASRRTDIPAFYLDWFMAGIRAGGFTVENPYNRRTRWVPARPADVHSIVFWSKDYGPFLRARCGERLTRRGYGFIFNFSINSPDPVLEPHVPPLDERLQQLAELAGRFGARRLQWRFDPLCFFRSPAAAACGDNLAHLDTIAAAAARLGIRECITSFVDLYPKVVRRARRAAVRFEDPPSAAKIATLTHMAGRLRAYDIRLRCCCEKEIVSRMPAATGVLPAACIPGPRLAELFGRQLHLGTDRGQRIKAGCGCNRAIDIGSYLRQPCYHNCLFCYARPQAPAQPPQTASARTGSPCVSARSN
jgi:DNA repair photolyase